MLALLFGLACFGLKSDVEVNAAHPSCWYCSIAMDIGLLELLADGEAFASHRLPRGEPRRSRKTAR